MARVEERWERLVRAVLRRERMGPDAYERHASGIAGNVPSSLANNRDIDEILRVADEIQDEDPNDDEQTLMQRVKRSDSRKMQSFYQQYYSQNLQTAADSTDSAVTKVQSTASVLLEVLKSVGAELDVDPEVLEAHDKLTEALNQRLT